MQHSSYCLSTISGGHVKNGQPTKPLAFPRCHQENNIKALYIKPKKASETKCKDNTKLDRYEAEAKLVFTESCTLFRRYGVQNFLKMYFDVTCPPKLTKTVLNNGLLVYNKETKTIEKYTFFGHSTSQLRERTCVLYNHSRLGDFDKLVNEFGNFAHLKTTSKKAARVGLLLSTAKPMVELLDSEIQEVDDVENEKFNFTDGCGFISLKTAMNITENGHFKDRYSHQKYPVPSVYQVRFKGCKGVLSLSVLLENGIQIRPSMEKFTFKLPEPNPLCVVDSGQGVSRPFCYGALNKQFIYLLSSLGVKDEIFLKKQDQYFFELDSLLSDKNLQIKYLCFFEYFESAEHLMRGGQENETISNILHKLYNKARKPPDYNEKKNVLLKPKKSPAEALRIPIDESRNIFGIADPSGKLLYGQCFFQPTTRRGVEIIQMTKIVVSKNPCYDLGDVRVLECIDIPECHHLVDCIVFPTNGHRPHPDEIAGSDLDGDKYFVCWDKDLIPPTVVKPSSYEGAKMRDEQKITVLNLISFFADYNSKIVVTLDTLYNKWADCKGIVSKECRLAASLFGRAVDSAKTGERVIIPNFLRDVPENEYQKEYVWIKMKKRARLYLEDSTTKNSSKPAAQIGCMTEDDIADLIQNRNNSASEYRVYRLAYIWYHETGNTQMFLRLLSYIDFTRMTQKQRILARIDLSDIPSFDMNTIDCALFKSRILNRKDIGALQGHQDCYSWNLHFRMDEDERFSWDILNSVFALDTLKLLIFHFTMRGQKWVFAFSITESLSVHDTIAVNAVSGDDFSRAYVSVHTDENDTILKQFTDDYLMTLDGERLQIFSNKGADRSITFICLMTMEDGTTGMSIALDRFSSSFPTKHKARLWREEVIGFEIFCRYPTPNLMPTPYIPSRLQEDFDSVHESEKKKSCDNSFIIQEKDFPLIGETVAMDAESSSKRLESLKIHLSDIQKERCLTEEDIVPLFDILSMDSVLQAEAAFYAERLIYTDGIILQNSKNGVHLIEVLLRNANDSSNIDRLLAGISNGPMVFSPEEYCGILRRMMFELPVETTALEFLQGVQVDYDPHWNELDEIVPMRVIRYMYCSQGKDVRVFKNNGNCHLKFGSGLFPLQEGLFHQSCLPYFLHWSALVMIEQMEDVFRNNEKCGNLPQSKIIKADIFTEKQNDDHIVWLNITGESSHPLMTTDVVALTPRSNFYDVWIYNPTYFAEVIRISGRVVNITVIWPEESDELLAQDVKCAEEEAQWRVDVFSNLVVLRRMLEAIKHACLLLSCKEEKWQASILSEICGTFYAARHPQQDLQSLTAEYFGDQLEKQQSQVCLASSSEENPVDKKQIVGYEQTVCKNDAKKNVISLAAGKFDQSRKSEIQTCEVSQQNDSHWSYSNEANKLAYAGMIPSPSDVTEQVSESTRMMWQPGWESKQFLESKQNKSQLRNEEEISMDIFSNSTIKKLPAQEAAVLEEKVLTIGIVSKNESSQRSVVCIDRFSHNTQQEMQKLNDSQLSAVEWTLSHKLSVIQGPPGTGKTHVAAVIIRCWMDINPFSKILIAAQTNEGVNNIVKKLLDFGVNRDSLLRLGLVDKIGSEFHDMTLESRYMETSQNKKVKKMKDSVVEKIINSSQVVCTTCVSSGLPWLRDISFPMVLIDEAAQALEPAILIPLMHGAHTLCLVGDDKQLPPLVQSRHAEELRVTLFERLRSAECSVQMLDTQYRMHPAIAEYPSQNFYGGMLKSGTHAENMPTPVGFEWPDPKKPVAFINIQSSEEYQGSSKFNSKEAAEVCNIIQKLTNADDMCAIGVITPYKSQVQRIQQLLHKGKLKADVRSVDGFQGQERDVIIFSAVRANKDGYVGFLNDKQRMNVTLTRAKYGLIVVGNKMTLEKCELWKNWHQWITTNGLMIDSQTEKSDQKRIPQDPRDRPQIQQGGIYRRKKNKIYSRSFPH